MTAGKWIDANGNRLSMPIEEQNNIAGLRNPSSETNSYVIAFEDWNVTTVDTSTNSTTVSDAPTRIGGVYVNTALSAHTVIIQDNATAMFTIPASAAAGTWYPFKGRCETSLIVNPDDASTGNISILWRPI